jgi:preprotein translocase subunit SecD
LGRARLHAIIGIEIGGKVVSAPIMQPTQSSFSSFNGQMQISGSFNEKQAKALAAEL